MAEDGVEDVGPLSPLDEVEQQSGTPSGGNGAVAVDILVVDVYDICEIRPYERYTRDVAHPLDVAKSGEVPRRIVELGKRLEVGLLADVRPRQV